MRGVPPPLAGREGVAVRRVHGLASVATSLGPVGAGCSGLKPSGLLFGIPHSLRQRLEGQEQLIELFFRHG